MKRRKQEKENKGDLARIRAGYHSMSGPRGAPNSPARSRGVLSTPTRSRGIRPNSGRLRSAAVAASAAVASVVAGCPNHGNMMSSRLNIISPKLR